MVKGRINKPGSPQLAAEVGPDESRSKSPFFDRRSNSVSKAKPLRDGEGDLCRRSLLAKEAGDLGAHGSLGDLGANPKTFPWLVLKTKTKCEKFVRDKIRALGMEAFVPLRKRTAKYNRKVKVYELPLITCYTFVRLNKAQRNEVLALPYVQGILRLNGKDCLVSELEMQWLQKVSGVDLEIRTETLSMERGDRVMLAYGQLAGMEGTIVSHRSKHEVVVALESIGMQMVIQVDPSLLVKSYSSTTTPTNQSDGSARLTNL